MDGRIHIKRGTNLADSTTTIESAGLPIIDTETKELFISTEEGEEIKNCHVKTRNATNVTSNIAGRAINNIFEPNSPTVKNATNATTATRALNADNATNATNVTSKIDGRAIESIFEGPNSVKVNSAKSADDATNVTSKINGELIEDIFETDSKKTVKNATNSKNVTDKIKNQSISDIFEQEDGSAINIQSIVKSATKATQDSAGNTITETYATTTALTALDTAKANKDASNLTELNKTTWRDAIGASKVTYDSSTKRLTIE